MSTINGFPIQILDGRLSETVQQECAYIPDRNKYVFAVAGGRKVVEFDADAYDAMLKRARKDAAA